jgi:hypothetical protein
MRCPHCGANLSLQDMTRPNCPYCQNVLAHHARAAEHAALVNRVLDDRIRAQYPGAPPDYGLNQGVRRAGWIMAVALIVPLMMVLLIGAGVAFALLMR